LEENISRTDAHKIFANLYRKNRSTEHQAKVDEIITRSNDVFIRIDLIKKLDEEYDRKERKERVLERKASPSSGGGSGGSSSSGNTVTNIPIPTAVDATKVSIQSENSKNVSPQKQDGGLIDRIFGSSNQISKFAKESKALDLGLLGRKPTLSTNVEKIFKFLSEEEIIGTAQALKFCEQVGWRFWQTKEYNIVVNFGRFFNSFISLDSLFKDEISPEVFLGRSLKMQMYYVRILQTPETKDIVLEKIPNLIKMEPKLVNKLEPIVRGLTYILTLEARRPSLKDSIIAIHVVMNKKLITWEEIESKLKVTPIDNSKFNAAPEIMKQIEMASAKVTNDIYSKMGSLEELLTIRNNYFSFKKENQISLDFIDKILDDYIARHSLDSPGTDTTKQTIRQSPIKLLHVLCRDIQTQYLPIFEGYIKIDEKGSTRDVLVFQNGLFFPEIDKTNHIIRSLDAFNRKFPSFAYTFKKYNEDLSKGTTDQIENQLLKLIGEAADFFGKFAKKIAVVVENDQLAKELEKTGDIHEKTYTTKEKVIEELKPMQRFIPFGSAKFVSQNRSESRTVSELLYDLTKLLYNYAVLFKDPITSNLLVGYNKLENEISKLKVEYQRLTGKEFTNTPRAES
jgi:hypothetical protein